MIANRIWRIGNRASIGCVQIVDDERRVATAIIHEVLAAPGRTPEHTSPAQRDIRRDRALPSHVPWPEQGSLPATRQKRRFRMKKRYGIVALVLGLAIVIGVMVGSGLNTTIDQPGSAGAYGIPEVQGHAGAR